MLFTLDGRPGPPEAQLDGWPGYAGSRPVRIGNGAAGQHQLDGYGWVVDAAWLLTDAGHPLYGETWRAVAAFADRVAATWTEPDAGIWEKRAEPAHHVHSKLMAWLALDRAHPHRRPPAATGTDGASSDGPAPATRSPRTSAAAGSTPPRAPTPLRTALHELDAAVLILPVLEFEPATSARVVGTVDAIRRRLGAGGPLLYRYPPGTDGLTGGEGAFLPCSFWLVRALALTGRPTKPEHCSTSLLPLGGPLGLFGEEMDPATGEHLGNYPQALTHAALVQAVLALDEVGRC